MDNARGNFAWTATGRSYRGLFPLEPGSKFLEEGGNTFLVVVAVVDLCLAREFKIEGKGSLNARSLWDSWARSLKEVG
jgi:hypothetical protein